MDHDLVGRHYGSDSLGAKILDALRAAGTDVEQLTPEDLAPVDQFHIGGRGTTMELIARADLPHGATVIDVGGGIGGPARTLAAEIDARVTVLDLTEEFCRAGEHLTDLLGMSDVVTFRHGNALDIPFGDGSFDVAWTQHSSMNIDDKEQLYAEMWRVVRPGGRLVIHEIMASMHQPIHFPVPWARGPEISFLRPVAEMRELIARTGFAEESWVDVSAGGIAFWRDRVADQASSGPPAPSLSLLMGPDSGLMGQNILRNLEEDRVAIIQAVFARTA